MHYIQNFFLAFLLASSVIAQEKKALKAEGLTSQVNINADALDYDTNNHCADAKDNVRLEYILKGKPLVIKSNTLHVAFDTKGALIEARAEGDVQIDYDGARLLATSCTHSFKGNKTICESDDVILTQESNELHGQKAILDFNAQLFTMQTHMPQQVTGLIYPKP